MKTKEKVLKRVMNLAWYSNKGYKILKAEENTTILPVKDVLKEFEIIFIRAIRKATDLTLAEVGEVIDERLKLNILRRKIFNEVPEHPDGIGSDVLVAKEMLNYEDRFLKKLKKEIEI